MSYFNRTMPGHTWQGLCKPSSKRVSLLPWPARSPDMSPIEHVWDMVGRRLIRQGPPGPTLDALWARIQTAWRDIPQEDIQGLFDSMSRRIETPIAAHGGFTPY